jgi:hypothetical protein
VLECSFGPDLEVVLQTPGGGARFRLTEFSSANVRLTPTNVRGELDVGLALLPLAQA